jgi:hypothetical protein
MSERPIPDISPVTGLKPQTRTFDGFDDTFVNADGIIAVMQRIDTPQAKAMNAAFRRRMALMRISMAGEPEGKIRQKALMAALHDVSPGIQFVTVEAGQ